MFIILIREIETNHQETWQALQQSLHNLHYHMDRSNTDITIDQRYLAIKEEANQYKRRVVEVEGEVG